jgi:beta-phosphoglucomutase
MPRYSAFIFDMNGTMIDDMDFHVQAWYDILVGELKAPLTRDEVKLHMYGKNEELFDRVFGMGKFSTEEMYALIERKESQYRKVFLPHLRLIDGLDFFLKQAKANHTKLAVATAANKPNIDYVLDNLHIRDRFSAVIGADDVTDGKPHPEVFLKAADALGVPPSECMVFEDSPKGIEAARRAGMKAVAITSFHTVAEMANDNVLFAIGDYNDGSLKQLIK